MESPDRDRVHDSGESWSSLVLTPFFQTDSAVHVSSLAISPADHQLLYAHAWDATVTLLLRSRDGGLTWESTTPDTGPAPCCPDLAIALLQPHGSDPARVLQVAGRGRAGEDTAEVDVSDDQATTWEHRGEPGIDGLTTDVTGLVGFGAVRPERLSVTTASKEKVGLVDAARAIDRSVFRSDDEGRSWTRVLSTVQPGEEARQPSVAGLAYEPDSPDWVYVAMGTSVQVSDFAGLSWRRLGRRELPRISALALSDRRRLLFAATDKGVWSMQLPI